MVRLSHESRSFLKLSTDCSTKALYVDTKVSPLVGLGKSSTSGVECVDDIQDSLANFLSNQPDNVDDSAKMTNDATSPTMLPTKNPSVKLKGKSN